MNARHLAVRGYCDLTDVVADHGCVLGRTKGNWQDVPNRSACLSLCASCASCNFASYGHDASGPASGDCSWFQHCDKLSRELSRSHRTYTVRRNGSLVDLPALNAALDRVNAAPRRPKIKLKAMFDAVQWLASAERGFCGMTSDGGDCVRGQSGSFELPTYRWQSWPSAVAACLNLCASCANCANISVSLKMRDCSWYASGVCQLKRALPMTRWRNMPMFRSGAAVQLTLHEAAVERVAQLPRELRLNRSSCFDVPEEARSMAAWRSAVRSHLTSDDELAFHRATGGTVHALLHHPHWRRSESVQAEVTRLLSNAKVVPHVLNELGLHALRVLLAERLADDRRRRLGLHVHPLYATLMRDGVLVLRPADLNRLNLSRRMDTPLALRWHGTWLAELLRMVSGYRHLEVEGFDEWEHFRHYEHDVQGYMHVDTFMPTWKAWVFKPTPLEAGPFVYVRGSHRSAEGRLRWLHNRTRALRTDADLERAEAMRDRLGITAEVLPGGGVFYDHKLGFDASIRFEGFDPQLPPPLRSLRQYGFDAPSPIVCDGPGHTIVIADTSGLHYRGRAVPGTVRTAARLVSAGDGEPWMPRKNGLFCEYHAEEC